MKHVNITLILNKLGHPIISPTWLCLHFHSRIHSHNTMLNSPHSREIQGKFPYHDRLTPLLSLKYLFTRHLISQRIQITPYSHVTINSYNPRIWIPGHADIAEHDLVDSAAKQATKLSNITLETLFPLVDPKKFYTTPINSLWSSFWLDQQSKKLNQIEQDTTAWPSSNRNSQQEEIVITRLRIAYTHLTHSHLFSTYVFPPSFLLCSSDHLTVRHLFPCPNLSIQHSKYEIPESPAQALRNDSQSVTLILHHLREIIILFLM